MVERIVRDAIEKARQEMANDLRAAAANGYRPAREDTSTVQPDKRSRSSRLAGRHKKVHQAGARATTTIGRSSTRREPPNATTPASRRNNRDFRDKDHDSGRGNSRNYGLGYYNRYGSNRTGYYSRYDERPQNDQRGRDSGYDSRRDNGYSARNDRNERRDNRNETQRSRSDGRNYARDDRPPRNDRDTRGPRGDRN